MSKGGSSSGIGFFGMLFITFLVLKLTNIIDWSWWWITTPITIPFVLLLGMILIVAFFGGKGMKI